MRENRVDEALGLLDQHYQTFHAIAPLAARTGHPIPMDTRAWSQVLVSTLTGVRGLDRKKGADLDDGSDVKGANTWSAIDTPRFNGVIKAGTQAENSNRIESLDTMPHLYFVLWDISPRNAARCRIWVVRPRYDARFRDMCRAWYGQHASGAIKSNNFQVHPPRGSDLNVLRNKCGNLLYPLLFSAERRGAGYAPTHFNPGVLETGSCTAV